MIKKVPKKSEHGQAIILIAAALIGLVAIVGLMTDGGILLIEYARLKRGIDAASIAAAQQFRRNFTSSDLENAARNFLVLNQSNVKEVHIYTCNYPDTEWDDTLCTDPISKLVRVTASADVNFGFMRVLGFDHTTITATSVGEAASIDLVLIMDTSLSMSYGTSGDPTNGNDAGDDPHVCNANNTCQPLKNIKTVAQSFIDTFLFFPYDRVAIVTMTDQLQGGSRTPTLTLPLSDDYATVYPAVGNLKVFEPPTCVIDPATPGKWLSPPKGPCLNYAPDGTFLGTEAPRWRGGMDLDINTLGDNDNDFTTIPSSNVGGTFVQANAALTGTGAPSRDDAFWVVIALISGPANATDMVPGYPDGICPSSTWNSPPRCRDSDLDPDGVTPLITRHDNTSTLYDADDYARDMADFIADPVDGNGIVIFTIGLGTAAGLPNSVRNSPVGLNVSGENLLRYAAESAGDTIDPLTGTVTVQANHGFYAYAEDPTLDLGPIFGKIAQNIFTRITQ